jgi:hypothetical protein
MALDPADASAAAAPLVPTSSVVHPVQSVDLGQRLAGHIDGFRIAKGQYYYFNTQRTWREDVLISETFSSGYVV